MRYINYDCRRSWCKACGQSVPIIIRVAPKNVHVPERLLFSVPEECRAMLVNEKELDVWCSQECLEDYAKGTRAPLKVVGGN